MPAMTSSTSVLIKAVRSWIMSRAFSRLPNSFATRTKSGSRSRIKKAEVANS